MSFVGGKTIRIVPDQPGRGGSKSSLSTQSQNLDVRTAQNVFVTYGRWRRAPEAILAAGYDVLPSCNQSFALHNYAAFDTTNANLPPINKLLSHDLMIDASHHIEQHNPLQTIKVYNPGLAPDAAVPATFLNIKNRCFMCWGATDNFIYDSANNKEYDVGIDAPATAATYTIGGTLTGLLYATAGSNIVTDVDGGTGWSNSIKSVFLQGTLYQTLQPTPFNHIVGLAPGGDIVSTGSSNVITVSAFNWPADIYNGLEILITGSAFTFRVQSYTNSGGDTLVTLDGTPIAHTHDSYTLSGYQLTLATPYLGTTSTALTYVFFEGNLQWTTPPQYAYAYYDDPATNKVNGYGTGHISDISPITFITEQNQNGVNVILDDIIPSGVADQPRFNKIQIFRTLLSAPGDLFPLDPSVGLIDNTGALPLTFTDSFDDSFLLTTGGFSAPRVTNRKPPPFAHQAYWDGRIWGNPVNDPSLIVFSGDNVDITYGVPEECYPSNFALRIPSDDGRVTGQRLVGPIMVITTERYAYYVGGGPDATSYRLIRFSTMMYGVQDYQMTEFAGQTTDDSDSMLYLGKDKKVYLTAPSLGNVPMSDPVQDVFTADITTGYADTRIADVALDGNHYIVCTLEGDVTEIYDFERKIWTDHTPSVKDVGLVRPEAFAKIYGTALPVQFLFIHAGTVYDWLGSNNTTGVLSAFIATNPIMLDSKKFGRVAEVKLYVSDNSMPWGVTTTVNEGPGFQFEAIEHPDPIYSIQPPGSFPLDSPNATDLISVPFTQPQPVIDGFRFQVIVNWPPDTVLRELYAVEITLQDIQEDGSVTGPTE